MEEENDRLRKAQEQQGQGQGEEKEQQEQEDYEMVDENGEVNEEQEEQTPPSMPFGKCVELFYAEVSA